MTRQQTVGATLLALFVSLPAQADNLVVGLSELDYPPYYYEEAGQLKGAAVELAETAAAQLGHTLSYQRLPWARVQYSLRSGRVDMSILYFHTAERAEDVVYTDQPYLEEASYLVAPRHLEVSYNGNLRALSDYHFVQVRGYSHGEEYDQADYLKKLTVNNEADLLKALATRRPFIGVGNRPTLEYHARRLELTERIRFLEPALSQNRNYLAFSRANPRAEQLADEFSAVLNEFVETEAFQRLREKYLLGD